MLFNFFPLGQGPNFGRFAIDGGDIELSDAIGIDQLLEGGGHFQPPLFIDLRWVIATKHVLSFASKSVLMLVPKVSRSSELTLKGVNRRYS